MTSDVCIAVGGLKRDLVTQNSLPACAALTQCVALILFILIRQLYHRGMIFIWPQTATDSVHSFPFELRTKFFLLAPFCTRPPLFCHLIKRKNFIRHEYLSPSDLNSSTTYTQWWATFRHPQWHLPEQQGKFRVLVLLTALQIKLLKCRPGSEHRGDEKELKVGF